MDCNIPLSRANNGISPAINTAAEKDPLSGHHTQVYEGPVTCKRLDGIHKREKEQQTSSIRVDKSLIRTILSNQSKMMSQLTKIQSTVNNLRMTRTSTSTTSEVQGTNEHNTSIPLFRSLEPAKNVQELDELEVNLGEEEYFAQVVSEMQVICSSGGTCRGLEACYRLIDYFTTRECLLHCSWAGNSKHDVQKVPFKSYTNFRKCFLTLVREADSTFSEQDCDAFFKTVLKNSMRRFQSKGLRMSTPRRRMKKMDWNLKRELIQHVAGSYNEPGTNALVILEEDNDDFDDTAPLDENNENEEEVNETI